MEPAWDHEVLWAWFSARSGEDVLETELLNEFFPDQAQGVANLDLYRKHFLLYRRLWLFDDELRLSSGHRLWIRGIRSTLVSPPPPGRCERLDPETGRYCLEPSVGNHCSRHDPTVPEPNGMKSYYLDPSHLDGMTEAGVQKLMDSFFGWWRGRPQVETALAVLGLPADADTKAVKARWRKLSLDHHPDRGGDPAQFKKISAAWAALKSWVGE